MKNTDYTIMPLKIFKDNYVWIILNEKNEALIVDPGEAETIIKFIQDNPAIKLAGILITHKHWDHCKGVPEIIKKYPVPVFGPITKELDYLGFPVKENDKVRLKGFMAFKVMEIPGHTLEHIAYYADGILFCGDTLFTGGCGRIFEGTVPQMYESLHKIMSLPDETLIYCGHEYTLANLKFAQIVEPCNAFLISRYKISQALRDKNLPTVPAALKVEKQTNPFLRCDVPEVAAAVRMHFQQDFKTPVEIFEYLRKWKDDFQA